MEAAGRHAHVLIKPLRPVIAAPYIQGDEGAALFFRVIADMAVQRRGHAPPPAGFVHAQIVDVKLFPVGERTVPVVAAVDAKAVTLHKAILLCHKNGAVIVQQQFLQGVFVIFQRAGSENIRSDLMVDFAHLFQQFNHAWNVPALGYANFHGDYLDMMIYMKE